MASSEVGTKPGLADQHEHQLKLAERLGTAVTLIKADPSRGTTKALELGPWGGPQPRPAHLAIEHAGWAHCAAL